MLKVFNGLNRCKLKTFYGESVSVLILSRFLSLVFDLVLSLSLALAQSLLFCSSLVARAVVLCVTGKLLIRFRSKWIRREREKKIINFLWSQYISHRQVRTFIHKVNAIGFRFPAHLVCGVCVCVLALLMRVCVSNAHCLLWIHGKMTVFTLYDARLALKCTLFLGAIKNDQLFQPTSFHVMFLVTLFVCRYE